MKRILITGAPGVGKTTLVRSLAEALVPRDIVGFYTQEIRVGGARRGFEAVAFASKSRHVLAHVDLQSPYKVGRYGVDIEGFDRFIEAIAFSGGSSEIILIDEIGKMECYSGKFRAMVRDVLSSDRIVVATVALDGRGLIADVKLRRHATLHHLDRANRDSLLPQIRADIEA
jgi:nucleoside-triphosphatase